MKKTIMGMMFLGSCCAALAQEDQTNNTTTNTSLQSSSNYSAYGPAVAVPANTQMAFTKDHPTATNVTWQKNSEWHRASYRNNNRNMQVFYSPNGSSYALALPVVQGYVAEDVIAKALDLYGDRLYSITRVKAADGQDTYQVTLTENGSTSTEWIGEDGSTRTNVYRTADAETTETKTTTTTTNNEGSGPSVDVNAEATDYSAVSPDDDYTYGYEEQMEWTTTAANTGTNLPDNEEEEDTTFLTNNSSAVLPSDEE